MPIVFIILMLFVIVGLYSHFNLIYYLKKHHNTVWENLGSPSFLNNSFMNNIKVRRFLSKKEYLDLNDTKLNKKASFVSSIGRIYMIVFIFVLLLFAMYILLHNLS